MPKLIKDWVCKPFEQLSAYQLYDIISTRIQVFIIEQQCFYLDTDEVDKKSFHLCGYDSKKKLIVYCRIVPPDVVYKNSPSIGRVLCLQAYRKYGLGKELMKKAIDIIGEQYAGKKITIGAQVYLNKFYKTLGFNSLGETYIEDGIPHIKMIKA